MKEIYVVSLSIIEVIVYVNREDEDGDIFFYHTTENLNEMVAKDQSYRDMINIKNFETYI